MTWIFILVVAAAAAPTTTRTDLGSRESVASAATSGTLVVFAADATHLQWALQAAQRFGAMGQGSLMIGDSETACDRFEALLSPSGHQRCGVADQAKVTQWLQFCSLAQIMGKGQGVVRKYYVVLFA